MEVYPVKVHRLFEDLGIDFTKEAEVYHMVRLRPGLHQYGGWFHCVGRVESETEEAGQFDIEAATGLFSLYFHDKPALVPACFQGLPLLQLEFNAQVAWVLQEPEARCPLADTDTTAGHLAPPGTANSSPTLMAAATTKPSSQELLTQ